MQWIVLRCGLFTYGGGQLKTAQVADSESGGAALGLKTQQFVSSAAVQ
jgi:hypothetical protein